MGATLLGLDIGSSSIKASLLDVDSGSVVAQATSPTHELPITALKPGWAEQHPDLWWEHVCQAVAQLKASAPNAIAALQGIGIAYQMHGLVLVDDELRPLRPAIIWCDSRAVPYGERAFTKMTPQTALAEVGNSPGNFTAAKLAWVKEHEPDIYRRTRYLLLPGDYIALKLSGEPSSTPSGLSEGVLWDFKASAPALNVCNALGIDAKLIPPLVESFAMQAKVRDDVAKELGLPSGIPITYRAGDQPNNAVALRVLEPGEVAANAGTSGVIYGVSDRLGVDERSRVNNFLHVTSTGTSPRIGMLLCINGAGSLYRWLHQNWGAYEYAAMDTKAASAPIGSRGLSLLPYGNGAERSLGNKSPGAQILGLELNIHTDADIFRAAQEGVVFAMKYGVEIMEKMGLSPKTIRAGDANLFKSALFRSAFANTLGTPIELYSTDGSEGAARAAGIGAKIFTTQDAYRGLTRKAVIEPIATERASYLEAYERWKNRLTHALALCDTV